MSRGTPTKELIGAAVLAVGSLVFIALVYVAMFAVPVFIVAAAVKWALH